MTPFKKIEVPPGRLVGLFPCNPFPSFAEVEAKLARLSAEEELARAKPREAKTSPQTSD